MIEMAEGSDFMGKVKITDFTEEQLESVGILIYRAAAEWFADDENARQYERECRQQKAS